MLVRQSPDSCNDLIAWQSGPSVNQRTKYLRYNTKAVQQQHPDKQSSVLQRCYLGFSSFQH